MIIRSDGTKINMIHGSIVVDRFPPDIAGVIKDEVISFYMGANNRLYPRQTGLPTDTNPSPDFFATFAEGVEAGAI